jgi:hypothetical protein
LTRRFAAEAPEGSVESLRKRRWTGYWDEKIKRNLARDAAQNDALCAAGWQVMRVCDSRLNTILTLSLLRSRLPWRRFGSAGPNRNVRVDCLPGDLLVRPLLGDLCGPLAALPADLRDPPDVRVVKLLDGLDSLHKFWKLLELRPVVVGLLYGDLNLNRIRDLGHEPSLGVMSIKMCRGGTRPRTSRIG